MTRKASNRSLACGWNSQKCQFLQHWCGVGLADLEGLIWFSSFWKLFSHQFHHSLPNSPNSPYIFPRHFHPAARWIVCSEVLTKTSIASIMCLIKAPPFRRWFFSICAFFLEIQIWFFDTFFRVFFLNTPFFSLWKVKPAKRSSVVGFGDVAFGEDFLSAFLNWRPEFHAEVEVLLDELKRSYMSTIWESRNVRNAAETAAFLGKKEPCFPKIQHGGACKSIFGLLKLPEKGYFTLHMLRFQLKALHNRCVSCIERAGVQKSSSRRCHWKSRVQVTSPAVRAQSDKCSRVIGQHLWLHPSIRKKLSFRVLSFVLCIQMDSAQYNLVTRAWSYLTVLSCRLHRQGFVVDGHSGRNGCHTWIWIDCQNPNAVFFMDNPKGL